MDRLFKNDIIVVGQQPWDTEIGSNCKNIALEFCKNNRVLYVNSPLDRITMIKGNDDPKVKLRLEVIRKKKEGLIELGDNLWNYYPDCMVESVNWINSDLIFNMVNRYNNYRFAKSIKKALKTLNFKNYLLFNDSEMFKGFYLKEFLKPVLSVYYSRDYMVAFEYWKKHGETVEPLLIAKSDICFANSAYLADYCRQYNSKSYDVGQGCEVDDFKNANKLNLPNDIAHLNHPIIGYVGALNSVRLDTAIIEHIALNYPEYTVLLVGPEDEGFKASRLHSIKNIVFTGQKQIDQLPAYVNAFDVCINPQLVNPATIGNYPRKIDEYLAAGKPTVVTATKTMEVFKDNVYMANTKENYITLIKKAIEENSPVLAEQRVAFATGHTWKNSVKKIVDQIYVYLNNFS